MSSDEVPVEALVVGGSASGGPPLGPALGPLAVPVNAVVAMINEATQEFAGLKVPVTVWVNKSTKPATFRVEVKTPMTSALIIKELGIEKGSGTPNSEKAGDISMEQLVKVTKLKRKEMTAKTLRAATKTVLGVCVSMGVTVDGGKDPRVVQKMLDDGEYTEYVNE
ncbi:MAG TPA: 50S ribosomal protein L11 [Candidatus Lokiarchaeia archaeon]|nr:50S ribosomal protein L11 [Candidatus Lokiarchaeia archaeon]